MRRTCARVERTPVIVQIRNVPDELHRRLKERAAEAGMSLSDYLLRQVSAIAARPTMKEMLARLQRRPPVDLPVSSADLIREERDGR